jgi:hypothetical protein
MEIQKFERDIIDYYKKNPAESLEIRMQELIDHIQHEWSIAREDLDLPQLKAIASTVIAYETQELHDELQELLAQKERIERQIDRKRDAFQESKYQVFDAIESNFDTSSALLQARVHQVKLQSLDLFDMLEEMVESAIITTLEKGHDIDETIREFTKEITYETLSEGVLSAIRIRKVVSTILQTAITMAEASPSHSEEILRGSLRGIRAGLVRSLSRLKKQLIYMPEEAKTALYDDEDEILKVDQLFTQVIQDASLETTKSCSQTLAKITSEINFDMQELVELSRETLEVMRQRFAKSSSKILNTKTAKEAKRMGVSAWSSAKTAMNSAIRTAKEKIDTK